MFRVRRYRIFLLAVVLSAASLFYFASVSSDVDRFRFLTLRHKDQSTAQHTQPLPPEHRPDPHPQLSVSPPPDPDVELRTSTTTSLSKSAHPTLNDHLGHKPTLQASIDPEIVTGEELLLKEPEKDSDLKEIHENPPIRAAGGVQPQWRLQKEHNPVPKDQIIPLPEGKTKTFSPIQYDFPPETSSGQKDRLQKLVTIREAFKHAWQGYETYALPHDELLPVSKSYSDSFMGWGATLIDNLDTLWIMDLKDEFELAVNATSQIDFKTSHKKEIPVFETVIRLLGGLLSAYDLSHAHYPILLDKAVELADVLMGAFDTPNRLPDLYYKWAPSYASQQHRAGTRAVLSQMGSLSMEFTRLAQLTDEYKYYDAIARIQNALEEWQMNTDMPGMWPLIFDASGCQKLDRVKIETDSAENEKPILLETGQLSEEDLVEGDTPADLPQTGFKDGKTHIKRQADDMLKSEHFSEDEPPVSSHRYAGEGSYKQSLPSAESINPYCNPQGLNYEPYAKTHKFGIAAQADSLYEYMPKMHRLLGGLSEQYESMYRNATKMIREKILYRPMIEDEKRKLLFPALFELDLSKKNVDRRVKVTWEATHLGCFAGGMFALGSKMFGIPSDMEIAKQLTDGCIWAYESTQTKIMPEKFALARCEDKDSCPWDETKWHNALDPNLKERMEAVEDWNTEQRRLYEQTRKSVAKDAGKDKAHAHAHAHAPAAAAASKPEPTVFKGEIAKSHQKRADPMQRDDLNQDESSKASSYSSVEGKSDIERKEFMPKKAMSHEQYVKARIQEERLPRGYTRITDRSYILRPEAIESVFIMWRITGEDYWREKGWDMFQAIQEATRTEVGNAGLEDVTSILGEKIDKMESFWLAETLKYFYLLFSDSETISLDDYVLNTEAHPFKVPKL